ncbi:MAG: hypothetical protein HZA90_01850 [Verrucomicrobia bacterium]|nr:hypothetical protein [Verrucomicrobiota bacterium]
MTRHALEHVIRAASGIALDAEFLVLGSQAVLGSFPEAPPELLVSRELDVYPKNKPEAADLIHRVMGEGSSFDETFGYYAHAVSPELATLPAGWEQRLIRVSTENMAGVVGWCLEIHDLAVSKLAAGRDKDMEFVRGLLRHRLADLRTIEQRMIGTTLVESERESLRDRLHHLAAEASLP